MTSTARGLRRTGAAGSWMIMLPPGWVTVPTDPERARSAVRAATTELLRGRHRDELVQARIEAERSMLEIVEEARKQGAAAVHALVRPVRGVPVSASLIVTELALDTDEEVQRAMSRVFGDAVGVTENGRVTVAGLPGLRRRRRAPLSAVDGAPLDLDVWETHLDYVLVTGPGQYLLLNFATATDPIADELVVLFEAMAESLHREQEEPPAGRDGLMEP